MKQPDNHIDELGEILKGFLKMFDGKTENPLNTATQQIEDFYRNKILEARVEGFRVRPQIDLEWKKYRGSQSFGEFYKKHLTQLGGNNE